MRRTAFGAVLALSAAAMQQNFVAIKGCRVSTRSTCRSTRSIFRQRIFKVSGGKIHEIEAMGFTAEYQSPTGWESHAGH